MERWEPSQRLPDQVADAFAVLYDWFMLQESSHLAALDEEWLNETAASDQVKRLREEVADLGWETPAAIHELIASATGRSDLRRRVYQALHGIDQGLGYFDPLVGGLKMSPLRDLYNIRSRYNTDAVDGYVLPKRSYGSRGDLKSDVFDHLVRAKVDRARVHLIGHPWGCTAPRLPAAPTIAVVPFLYTLADVDFFPVEHRGKSFFTIVHKPAAMPDLTERLRAAVRAIRTMEANIAIFPELAMNPQLLDVLKEELRNTEPVTGSSLAWVVVGSYTDCTEPGRRFPVYNSACVLEGSGHVIESDEPGKGRLQWVQSKRHPYEMKGHEQTRYGLTRFFPDVVNRKEAISHGGQVFVFNAGMARLAVMICEDFSQEEETCAIIREMNCQVVFGIVMDGIQLTKRWTYKRAEALSDQSGAFIVVADSMLLVNQSLRAGQLPPYPVGFVLPPEPSGSSRVAKFVESPAMPDAADDTSLIAKVADELPILPWKFV